MVAKNSPEDDDHVFSIEEKSVQFEDGFRMRYFYSAGKGPLAGKRPPIVFLHGSFHSGWCFAEHWMQFFSEEGYDCYSISFRGTSESPDPLFPDVKVPNIEQHVVDVLRFNRVMNISERLPILAAHSFGGMVAMKTIQGNLDKFSAVALFCSVPPSGNGPMTKRFIDTRGWEVTWDITRGFVLKDAAQQPQLCKKFFFSEDMDDDKVLRYMQEHFRKDSNSFIDLQSVLRRLPVETSKMSDNGKTAAWAMESSKIAATASDKVLVFGAKNDFLVDDEGVVETARFLNVDDDEIVWLEGAHDVMLDVGWKENAERFLEKLQ